MTDTNIFRTVARQILDSRGNPTLEVDIWLGNGVMGRAAVPSGAYAGTYEALEVRDGEKDYNGLGVMKAIDNINGIIAPKLAGVDATKQMEIDMMLILLDGTDNKSKLGANSISAVSMAVAKAAANAVELPLYQYLGGPCATHLPLPFINVINGGIYGNSNLDFQEFMIAPVGAQSFSEAIRIGSEVTYSLRKILKEKGLSTSVEDEGGFSPQLKSHEEAMELIIDAIDDAGYKPEQEICIALDCAATEFYKDGKYILKSTGEELTSAELIDSYEKLSGKYPIISIEDGLSEDDWSGWKAMTERLGTKIQLVGDDLFATNIKRIRKGIHTKAANSVLIKLNQIGTLSETLSAIEFAKRSGYTSVISHRSGETDDTFISHLSVATNAGQIKTGSICRMDRVSKYNELLRIEEDLRFAGQYYGRGVFYNLGW
ncbi:MAG: phosphopyruvate hydratase [Candidatus Eremiobacterota bacterium]